MSNDSLKDIRLIKDVIELIEKKYGPVQEFVARLSQFINASMANSETN